MMSPSSSPTLLILFTCFALYYQVVLGYILTLILRVLLRGGVARLVKKKRKEVVKQIRAMRRKRYHGDEYASGVNCHNDIWELETSLPSIFSLAPSKDLLRLFHSRKLRCGMNSCDGGIEGSDEEDEGHAEEKGDTFKVIGASLGVSECRIESLNISPFSGITGSINEETRIFLLGLSLQNIKLKCRLKLSVKSDSVNGSDSGTSVTASTQEEREVEIDFCFYLDAIRLHLVSQGLLLLGYRQLRALLERIKTWILKKRDGDPIEHAGPPQEVQASTASTVTSDVTVASSIDEKSNGQPFYILKKIIGGIDVVGLNVSSSVRFHGTTAENSKDGAAAESMNISLSSKSIIARLETTKESKSGISVPLGQFSLTVKMETFKVCLDSVNSLNEGTNTRTEGTQKFEEQCISIQSLLASMSIQSDGDNNKRASINVEEYLTDDEMDHGITVDQAKYGAIELISTYEQMNALSRICKEWVRPIILDLMQAKRPKKLKSPRKLKKIKNVNTSSFTIDDVSIGIGARIKVINDMLGYPDTLQDATTVKGVQLGTRLEMQLNDLRSDHYDDEWKSHMILHLTLAETTLSQLCNRADGDIGLLDILKLNDLQLSLENMKSEQGTCISNLEICLDHLDVGMDDAELTESTISFALCYHQAISILLAPQKVPKLKRNSEKRGEKTQVISLSLRSCGVNMVARSKDDEGETGSPVVFFTKAENLSICISSYPSGKNRLSVNLTRLCSSLIFLPHEVLPTVTQCLNEITLDDTAETPSAVEHHEQKPLVEFSVAGSDFIVTVATEKTTQKQNIAIQASDLLLKEVFNHGSSDESSIQVNELLKTDGVVRVSIDKEKDDEIVLQTIDVQTHSAHLQVMWSPILQWFIFSAIKRSENLVLFYLSKIANKSRANERRDKEKTLATVKVQSNDTSIKARVVLGGGSVVDTMLNDLCVLVTKDPTATWDKPDITFSSGRTRLNLNQSDYFVAIFDSIRYFNGIRLASENEIEAYLEKKGDGRSDLREEIVTGHCGTPVVEMVEIDAGERSIVDLPPTLDLGKVIEDINLTLPSLQKSRLTKSPQKRKKKYQLMDIRLTIPTLTADFLEVDIRKLSLPVRFAMNKNGLLERWKFHIKDFQVKIKRHTPPEITQRQLREMDEDKTRTYVYGPMIQGGEFDIYIGRIINTLHPLNLSTPLGDITNFRINGLIYLATLSPEMEDLINGHQFCVPVKCHHGINDEFLCSCDYAMVNSSRNIPVKIYHQLTLASDCLYSNYGNVLMPSIPYLMKIIQRLIPKPPIVDSRCLRRKDQSPPLDWWDNLRFQFHGTLQWRVEKFAFRWLLDSVTKFDWSLFLTANNFVLTYATGSSSLEMDSVIISVPDSSYHMMEFGAIHNGSLIMSQYLENAKPGFRQKRHPLVLFPRFMTQFCFQWEVSPNDGNHSSKHHNVYVRDEWAYPISMNDKFEHFRSHGWEILWDFKLSGDASYASWVALRGDVLPWVTHKAQGSIPVDPSSEDEDENGSDPLPKVKGIRVNVDISTLNVGVYFDERNETSTLSSKSNEPEGIYLQVPEFKYTLSAESEHSIDFTGSVQAALLDMTERRNGICFRKQPFVKGMEWSPKHYPQSHAETNNLHSLQIFDTLQHAVMNTKAMEYLLIVDQIKILDKALDDIRQESDGDTHNLDLNRQESGATSTKKEAPWTVLVAGMKLLWTVDIRDSVMSIVKDVLFAINFMQVNSRGTPQLLESESETKRNANDDPSFSNDRLDEENGFETIAGYDEQEVNIFSTEVSGEFDSEKPKSSLDYLLSRSAESKRGSVTGASPMSQPSRNEKEFASRTLFNNLGGKKSTSSVNDIVPTFDLHLSNPQIQLHSEKTGGSVILGICGAYIESRKLTKLFADKEAYDADDLRLETLMRRTEFVYTLDRLQLFSMSNSVDVDVGLQWLNFELPNALQPSIEAIICNHSDTSVTMDQSLESLFLSDSTPSKKSCPSPDAPKRHEQRHVRIKSERTAMFPEHLSIFDTKEFVLPNLCSRIMDPATFKTRQEFHRPPIDLTKEELAEVIEQKLVSLFDTAEGNTAIDYVEMFLDELSFNLDSYQFSTTLDVIRNVILEPPKPRQERYYQVKNDQLNSNAPKEEKIPTGDFLGKDSFEKMEKELRALREGSNKQTKRGREYLRSLANELLGDIEYEQPSKSELSTRRIEYTLCKAKWKITSPDSANNADAVISFTGFKGTHNFTADGSCNSQISLEDLHVISEKDHSDATEFSDPSVILKTVLGVERSVCQRCGEKFDRETNEVHSCVFHSGDYQAKNDTGEMMWTCCQARQYDAPGCVARPHTGTERAVDLRFDALPRKLDGLTMYKHLEGNMYPGVPYTIIVQLTKSTIKSFMDYFLGNSDDPSETLQDVDVSHISKESFDNLTTFPDTTSQHEADGQTNRKFLLFGSKNPDGRNVPASSTHHEAFTEEKKGNTNQAPKGEICFIKNWRLGDINICLSVAGFGKIVDLTDLNLVVSNFERAYKIGTVDHLARKLIAHLLKSLMVNSPELLKAKFVGKTPKNGTTGDHRNSLHSLQGDSDEEAADLLFTTHSNDKKKKKKKRLFRKKKKN